MAGGSKVMVVLNFSDKNYENYRLGADGEEIFTEVLYSDSNIYSGNTPTVAAKPVKAEKIPYKKFGYSFADTFAPFSAKIYEVKNP
jgi:1,4-alpha-glucan branching enzyme